jgi:hypothetical protein
MGLSRILKKHKNDIYDRGFKLLILKVFKDVILVTDVK